MKIKCIKILKKTGIVLLSILFLCLLLFLGRYVYEDYCYTGSLVRTNVVFEHTGMPYNLNDYDFWISNTDGFNPTFSQNNIADYGDYRIEMAVTNDKFYFIKEKNYIINVSIKDTNSALELTD
ncbi:MAG: hypothetical protein LUD48_05675 [Prevotella sp.]|nr:hypothetical protein [Prevotella sp.]